MTKYHINSHGVPAPCKAKPGNCPFGGDDSHFDNIEDAQSYVDSVNEEEYGLVNKVDSGNISYEVPENTPKERDLDPVLFNEENHKLIKQDGQWIHINGDGEVIGTMGEPTVVYDDKGRLASVIDKDDTAGNITLKTMQVMRTLSRLNLTKDSASVMRHANFFNPEEDLNEYKGFHKKNEEEAFNNGLDAIKKANSVRGAEDTKDLFYDKENPDEMSEKFLKDVSDSTDYLITEPMDREDYKDNLDDIPTAEEISLSTWSENNLDIANVNGKWVAINNDGEVYGSLENPSVALNLKDKKILAIGERENIESMCLSFEKSEPKLSSDIASVNLDEKNNSLTKTRELFNLIDKE